MTILIDFLGCKVNSYEAECVAKDFLSHGYNFFDANKDTEPDVIVVNTCAVTETSVTKDKKTIRKLRRNYPNSILVVMGCYAQYGSSYIINELNADICIGTSHRNEIYSLVEDFRKKKEKIIKIEENNTIKKYENLNLDRFHFNTRAYVKIQDGCNNFCSYCLIPYVRGRSRSRKKDEIIDEINRLIKNGYKEVVLTGIDMSSYGLDLDENVLFSDLIEEILTKCPNLYRLRISSLEESQVDQKFINLLQKYHQLANHLHMPLQSGSENVLKNMNRKYNIPQFYEKISKIREIRPDISITTDVIVGFPGETEEDFLKTFEFCKKINFSKIHVFPYSDRNGTVASKRKDKINPQIKKDRVNRLLELSKKLEDEYSSQFYNQEIDFLCENYDENLKSYVGHSSNYLQAKIMSSNNVVNEIVKVKFTNKNKLDFWQCKNLKISN